MKYEELDTKDFNYSQEYIKTCSVCDKKHKLLTQKDECPEYYTEISLRCDCGEAINFSLPVN